MLPLLLACAKPVSPPPAVAEVAAPAPAEAPRLFDAAGLRDGFVLGTHLRIHFEIAGQPPYDEEWTVTGHTPDGCTIHAVTRDAAGAVTKDEEGTSTWAELESHASFPAAATELVDTTQPTALGELPGRRYTVRDADGSVKVLFFAAAFAGPPVTMEITKDGAVVFRMTMVERGGP